MNEKNTPNETVLEAEESMEPVHPSAEEAPVVLGATDQTATKPYAVCELSELRKENRKVFRMSDGTEQAVFYSHPVHVLDEETQTFEEVRNILFEEEDGKHIRNGKSHFLARFSCEEDNDELFAVEKGNHRIKVLAKKPAKNAKHGVKPSFNQKGKHSPHTLQFANVMAGADVEYSVNGSGVKEDIIVREKAMLYRYPFILECENVVAEPLRDEGIVNFCDPETRETVFTIPAPFMTDANGVSSTNVAYDVTQLDEAKYSFTVTADSTWMNAEDRVFPVTIDPQINVPDNDTELRTFHLLDGNLYGGEMHTLGSADTSAVYRDKNVFIRMMLPALPCNPRIKKAELKLIAGEIVHSTETLGKLKLYHMDANFSVDDEITLDDLTLVDYEMAASAESYTFDVTNVMDMISNGEATKANFVLTLEDCPAEDSVQLYGASDLEGRAPVLCITYDSTYGVNAFGRTHTHELGRFGQGSVDLQCGNLMIDSEDFAWAGNRMPVTIRHLYNSALAEHPYTANAGIKLNVADFSAMKLGVGWKLNLMQSMVPATFLYEGVMEEGYIFTDENGSELYFKKTGNEKTDENCTCYYMYANVDDEEMTYHPLTRVLKTGTDRYLFDTAGRLIKITDEYKNTMEINYDSGRITSVKDGVNRYFHFAYDGNGHLTSITAPDETSICYTYSADDVLASITYPDGRCVYVESAQFKPQDIYLVDAEDNDLYKVNYTFVNDKLASVTEYGVENDEFVRGIKSTYTYSAASNRTLVQTIEPKDVEEGETEDTVITTVYTFDNDGEVIGTYAYVDETEKYGVSGEGAGIHPYAGEEINAAFTVENMLLNHNFEAGLDHWISNPADTENFRTSITDYASNVKYGRKSVYMFAHELSNAYNSLYQEITLPKGKYTFSTHVKVAYCYDNEPQTGAHILVTHQNGAVLAESEHFKTRTSGFVRLVASFELAEETTVRLHLATDCHSSIYFNAPQLEKNEFANPYNMLSNSNFEQQLNGWTVAEEATNVAVSTDASFNMTSSLKISSELGVEGYASQKILPKEPYGTRETFTLSGWAKGCALVARERNEAEPAVFRLRAVMHCYDYATKENTTEEFTANFSACTADWQFASVQFAKTAYAQVNDIEIFCEYSNNVGDAYFDAIQLVRDSIETGLTSSDFVEEADEAAEEETVAETKYASAPEFEEKTDGKGNTLTETTFTDGEFGTIYKSFGFSENANDLLRETDARGNDTTYVVNEETSRNEQVVDRCGNKTIYQYDEAGNTIMVANRDANGADLAQVEYFYDGFNNLTEIIRGDGMKYSLVYNAYHQLESIGVAGAEKPLTAYTYKNGNGRLKEVTYANGHTMKATYNNLGQMVAEKWFDSANSVMAHYRYVYDGQGNIVRSIDFTQRKEYNYFYEEDKLVRANECSIEIDENLNVVGKTVDCYLLYTYDAEGNQTKKEICIGDVTRAYYYEHGEDKEVVSSFWVEDKYVTSHSKNDSFGRKVFDELQLGGGFVSRQFTYHAGEVTEEHVANNKLKSSPTTSLVSRIILSDGRTISYEYDAEERITKVTDSVDGTTEYTYDALGQLLTETKDGVAVNTMTYDNYGNILTKNGVAYTCADPVWKDKLTGYGEQTITYDAQGNPISYLGHTLTWEKGRQLKSFDDITYTYNANGIRTSKTVDGVKHTYILDGAKILKETWGTNSLIPLYSHEDEVCGILYNDIPYYFLKNLQGDIISITDKNGAVVAKYSYDAWGVCSIAEDTTECRIATVNPFRYRGYYFDQEIGLYYVSSRYYDPEIGRFVNGDEVENTLYTNIVLDYNIFTYVQNNPVVLSDSTGESWITDLWKKAKKGVSSAWNWLKKACSNVGNYFKNTVWKKWIVTGVWNTFCKKWVWEKFCKEMVYNTFIKKWVWQTFCKKWIWQTFCKKWVWQTFCKKWVWETFCKDWIANKAWNWLKGNWKRVVDGISVFGGSASWVIDVLAACGIVSVAPPLAVALLIFGGICLVWDVLRYFGVI